MEEFVRDIKVLAMGGAPQSLIKTMSEGDDPSGGFLVPEEFNAEVVRYTAESAVVRPRARVLPMGRDKSTWPKLVQTSSDDFAGISLSWGTESTLATASNPTLGKLTLSVNKLIGLVPLTNELLGDAAIDIVNFLVSLFGEAIAYEEDKQFIQGTGVGKPQGIIPVATAVTRASSTTIGYADLISMFTNVPAWAQANAVWLTNMSGLAKIMAIGSNTTGVFFMMPGGFTNAPQMSVFGKPLILTEKVASLGSKGDIIYGDLRRYWIGDRGGLQVASSMHDRFRYDETTVRFIKRTDGQAEQPRAFVVLKP